MQTVGAFEAKTHFSVLLEQIEEGEQAVITVKRTIQSLKEFHKENSLAGLDWKVLRDEGRR